MATLCLSTTSGPGPGELPGFWGSMPPSLERGRVTTTTTVKPFEVLPSCLCVGDIWNILVRYNKEIVTTGATEELLDFMIRINNEYNESTDDSDGS